MRKYIQKASEQVREQVQQIKVVVVEKKSGIIKWLTIISTILGILVSGFIVYDRFFNDEESDPGLKLEQTVSPETMEKIKKEGLVIEKGITIKRDAKNKD